MKLTTLCLALCVGAMVFCTGCVPVTYKKTVTTHMDSKGNITETVIVEEMTEPHTEKPRIQSPSIVELKNIQK